MILIHEGGGQVDCHKSQVENMKRFGWVEPKKQAERSVKLNNKKEGKTDG